MTAAWLTLALAISVSIGGQVLLKTGASDAVQASAGFIAQLFRPHTIIGLACYGGAALLYMIALRRIPMSVALPCTAASYVAVMLIGWLFFNEPIGVQKLAAMGLICGGVVMLAASA